jgi:hypothetical protein
VSTTVWAYVDTSKQVGDPDHLKLFADQDAAEQWLSGTTGKASHSNIASLAALTEAGRTIANMEETALARGWGLMSARAVPQDAPLRAPNHHAGIKRQNLVSVRASCPPPTPYGLLRK